MEGSEKVGDLKCRKNAVKMEGTSKSAGKVAFLIMLWMIWEGPSKQILMLLSGTLRTSCCFG